MADVSDTASTDDEDERRGLQEVGTLSEVGNIYTYQACTRPNCYYAKIGEGMRCNRCNTVSNGPTLGLNAMVTIKGFQTSITAKIFKQVLSQFYHQVTGEELEGNEDEIEDKLLDIIPCDVQYSLSNQTPRVVTHLEKV